MPESWACRYPPRTRRCPAPRRHSGTLCLRTPNANCWSRCSRRWAGSGSTGPRRGSVPAGSPAGTGIPLSWSAPAPGRASTGNRASRGSARQWRTVRTAPAYTLSLHRKTRGSRPRLEPPPRRRTSPLTSTHRERSRRMLCDSRAQRHWHACRYWSNTSRHIRSVRANGLIEFPS